MTDTVKNVLQDEKLENVSGGGGNTGSLGAVIKHCDYCNADTIHFVYRGGYEICINNANHKNKLQEGKK